MNAEFNWWLLIVGLVVGAALTWLVMAESARRDADVSDEEQRGEAVWISSLLSSPDRPVEPRRVEEILRLHREYLAGPPPDEPGPADRPDDTGESEGSDEIDESADYDFLDELEARKARAVERSAASGEPAATVEPETSPGAPTAPAGER